MLSRAAVVVVAAFASIALVAVNAFVVPPAQLASAPYADWAHHHWVWLDASKANQTSMLEYVKDYLSYDIPVGAADIDSSWESGFNNFQFDSTRFPDPASMVNEFHSENVRVIFWITSMIDTDSSNYNEAIANNYVLRNAFNVTNNLKWWHGMGSLLDYSNPAAVSWWHAQMDPVLALGIDGWKVDGTDPYMMEYLSAQGYQGTVSYREYADSYYGDFFNYTRAKLGDDRLIMSRPVDGFDPIWLSFSPRYTMFSGWVGDQDPTYDGLVQALLRYLQSAWNGYVGFGSDIGGYRSGDCHCPLGRTKDLFTRWAQLGAFSPLMENGGNNEHRPWIFGNDTLAIYRDLVNYHMQMVPYLLAAGSEAYDAGTSIITPLAPHNTSQEIFMDLFDPPTFNYLLGPSILVAPITSNTSVVNITFPAHHDWVDWFNNSNVYYGGISLTMTYPQETFPAFYCTGCVIPLNVSNSLGSRGDVHSSDALTLLVHTPTACRKVSKTIRRFRADGLIVTCDSDGSAVEFTATAQATPLIFALQNVDPGQFIITQHVADSTSPSKVTEMIVSPRESLADLAHAGSGVYVDRASRQLFIRPAVVVDGVHLSLRPATQAASS